MSDERPVPDHRSRLRLRSFAAGVPEAFLSSEAAREPSTMALDETGLAALITAARRGASPAELAAMLCEAGVPDSAAGRIVAACPVEPTVP
jgi:hypothetical protein